MIKDAEFSPCGKYRYHLSRHWDNTGREALCIGLNPSTADSDRDDPTIIHLTAMLKKLGYGGFYMMNLFALISPNPMALIEHPDPVGFNDKWLDLMADECDDVIFCWGAFKQSNLRSPALIKSFPKAHCFGFNKDGSPMHPLAMMYQGKTKNPQLIPYQS